MKRFIDLRGQYTAYNFAWFDTITDTFEMYSNNQCWDTWEDFEQDVRDYKGMDILRYKALLPSWVK